MAKVNGQYTETTQPKDLYEDHDGIDDPKITDFLLNDDPMLWDRGYQLETEDGTWYELFLKERAHDDSPKTSKELTDNQKKLVELLSSLYKGSLFRDLIDYGQITFYVSSKEELLDWNLIYASIKSFFSDTTSQSSIEKTLNELESIQIALSQVNEKDIKDEKAEKLKEKLIEKLAWDGKEYSSIADKYKEDKEFNLTLLKENAKHFEFMSDELKVDEEILITALEETRGEALQFADDKFKSDRKFILEMLPKAHQMFFFISPELQKDREIALLTARSVPGGPDNYPSRCDITVFEALPEIFKSDKEFLIEAIKQQDPDEFDDNYRGLNIAFIPEVLKADEELVKLALENSCGGGALKYASDELKDNKDFLLRVKKSKDVSTAIGSGFQYASERIRGDRDIVLKLLNDDFNDWVKYIADPIKVDKELMLKIVEKIPWALEYADESLQNDKDLIEAGR